MQPLPFITANARTHTCNLFTVPVFPSQRAAYRRRGGDRDRDRDCEREDDEPRDRDREHERPLRGQQKFRPGRGGG